MTTLSFLAQLLKNCQIMCDILVLITLRVLQRAGWRWMELGAQFSNTFLKFCCKTIISWIFIICSRILLFHLNSMISSKDISASQRFKVFTRYFLYATNFAMKFKYSEERFGAFFAFQLLSNFSAKFSTFSLFVFLLIKFIS